MMAMAMAMANETAHQPTPMMQLYWQSTTPVQAASCVLTVPIAFEEASRAALAGAAVIAGLVPLAIIDDMTAARSEEHTTELQSLAYLVCRLLLEKKISIEALGMHYVRRFDTKAFDRYTRVLLFIIFNLYQV